MKNSSRRKVPAGRKDKDYPHHDQDLALFQELHKREKDRNILTLLQPVSEEFEPNGNYQLYKIASAKKGSGGFEFLAENKDKNDYDWLKTPPATPLFPSLEMEANNPDLIIQREIPILQPLSRFAAANCKSDALLVEHSNGKPTSGNPKSKLPIRSVTPSTQRQTNVSNLSKQTKNTKAAPVAVTTEVPFKNQQKAPVKSATAEHNETMKMKATTTSRTGAASPLPDGFSNQTPPNLRTDKRSISATRDRCSISATRDRTTQAKTSASENTHLHRSAESRRPQSSSSIANVSKGQNINSNASYKLDINSSINEGKWINTSSPKGNETQVLGSRMVQRVMNARSKAATFEEKEKKPTLWFLLEETSGFGRLTPKNSMDITLKNMVRLNIKRDGS